MVVWLFRAPPGCVSVGMSVHAGVHGCAWTSVKGLSQVGVTVNVCVSGGFGVLVVAGVYTFATEIPQAPEVRNVSQGPTEALRASLHFFLRWEEGHCGGQPAGAAGRGGQP